MSSPTDKVYVDRGTQTVISTPISSWPGRSVSSSKNSSTHAHNGSLSDYSSNAPTSTLSYSRSSSLLDGAYSRSLPPDSPSPVRSAIMTRRIYKRQKTPYSRPSSQKFKKRVVSLPKDPPMHHTETTHESTTRRVVSLPDRIPSSPMFARSNTSSDVINTSLFVDHSIFAGEDQLSRIRVRRPSMEEPHTPSPPSSPDSVLIIEDHHQLAEAFLRNNTVRNSPRLFSDDEGVSNIYLCLDISLIL
jgi:hypothetical protein